MVSSQLNLKITNILSLTYHFCTFKVLHTSHLASLSISITSFVIIKFSLISKIHYIQSCTVLQKVFFCIVIGHGKAHSIRAVFVGKTSRARVAECWLGRAVVQKGSLISVIEMQTEVQLPFHIRQRWREVWRKVARGLFANQDCIVVVVHQLNEMKSSMKKWNHPISRKHSVQFRDSKWEKVGFFSSILWSYEIWVFNSSSFWFLMFNRGYLKLWFIEVHKLI